MAIRTALLLAAFLAGTTSASADPIDDFLYWKTALAIDSQCHALKYLERVEVEGFADDALQLTGQYVQAADGRMAEADYTAWLAENTNKAVTDASQYGCGTPAEPFVGNARNQASGQIFQALLLATHFANLPADDLWRTPLSAAEQDAMARYSYFLQQVYGPQFPQFAESQRQAAIQRVPVPTDPMGTGTPSYVWIEEDTDFERLIEAQQDYQAKLANVLFEVSAEINGWRVPAVDALALPSLVKPDGSEPPLRAWYGPTTVPMDSGEQVSLVIVQMPDRSMQVMTYGDIAKEKLATARLFVRTAPVPDGASASQLFDRPEWSSFVTEYVGQEVEGICLGGPCFAFPAEATDALLAGTDGEYSELWLSADPSATPDLGREPHLRGRVSNFFVFKLAGL